MKLKLTLTPSELQTLATCLNRHVAGKARDTTLREYVGEFLALSVLFDLTHTVTRKHDKLRWFGGGEPKPVKLTMTRNQALALYCYINEVLYGESPELSHQSFEGNLLQRLYSLIHRAYLV